MLAPRLLAGIALCVATAGAAVSHLRSLPHADLGNIALEVHGLPDDVSPSLTVIGPEGPVPLEERDGTVRNVPPGRYRVLAAPVEHLGMQFVPTREIAAVAVQPGQVVAVDVTYQLPMLVRAEADRAAADAAAHPKVKVVYVVPRDRDDRGLDTNGTLAKTVVFGKSWLTSRLGRGNVHFDVADGALDVAFVRAQRTDDQLTNRGAIIRDSLKAELSGLGPIPANTMLLAYLDGGEADHCGGTSLGRRRCRGRWRLIT